MKPVVSLKAGIVVVAMLCLCSCMKLKFLPYMDQALTLQDLGQEKDRQEKYVANVDAKFDRLYEAVSNGSIKSYATQGDIIKAFGQPITTKMVVYNNQNLRRALYRYAIASKGPHKVYLYFDHADHLIHWEAV